MKLLFKCMLPSIIVSVFPKFPVMTLVDEPLIRATTYIPLMDNADSSVTEGKREAAELVRHDGLEGLQKTSVKKLKNETDKGIGAKEKAWPGKLVGCAMMHGYIVIARIFLRIRGFWFFS